MNYRDVADLNDQVVRWVSVLPADIDVVVGIPRSGLLVANLLAMYLNLPMTDVDGLTSGRLLSAGMRYTGRLEDFFTTTRQVLVVDDSVSYGGQMARVKAQIDEARLPHHIQYGAVYITPGARDNRTVDFFCEVVPRPRVFEWNVMHHSSMLKSASVEIDGVLGRLLPDTVGLREAGYEHALEIIEPLWLPRSEIGWVLTSRPERVRTLTDDWLGRHGVRYTGLIMMEDSDRDSADLDRLARFKAEAYVSIDADLHIEHSASLSARIARLSGRPVYSIETREMLRPGLLPSRRRLPPSAFARWAAAAYHETVRVPRLLVRRIARIL